MLNFTQVIMTAKIFRIGSQPKVWELLQQRSAITSVFSNEKKPSALSKSWTNPLEILLHRNILLCTKALHLNHMNETQDHINNNISKKNDKLIIIKFWNTWETSWQRSCIVWTHSWLIAHPKIGINEFENIYSKWRNVRKTDPITIHKRITFIVYLQNFQFKSHKKILLKDIPVYTYLQTSIKT